MKMCVTCNICGGTFSKMDWFDTHWLDNHALTYDTGINKHALLLSYEEGKEDWAMERISSFRKANHLSPYAHYDTVEEVQSLSESAKMGTEE